MLVIRADLLTHFGNAGNESEIVLIDKAIHHQL